MTSMQAAVLVAIGFPLVYAYFLTVLVTDKGIDGFPGPVRFIATLTPRTSPPSLLGRLTSGLACVLFLGLLFYFVTVGRSEFDSIQLTPFYGAIALALLWTGYIMLALQKRRTLRRGTGAPGEPR